MRLPAKQDDAELIEICSWIRKRYPTYTVLRDWFVHIDPTKDAIVGYTSSVTEAEMGQGIWHRPDIVITDNVENIKCIVEIDGSIHRTFARGKTAKRNKHYEEVGVPHLIIDKYETPDVMTTLARELPKFL